MNMTKAHSCRRGLKAAAAFAAAASLLLAACAICASAAGLARGEVPAAQTLAKEPPPIIVIDAGHGGADGGASAPPGMAGVPNGIDEKDINLAVAKKLQALFALSGAECIMTRTDDRMLVPDSVTSRRKMHDLQSRVEMVRAAASTGREVRFVSIHMNKFSDPRYSGLQVWHAANEESRTLAQRIQTYAKTFLAPDNSRQIKKTTSAIYILEHAAAPSVLVECGFLSNPAECARLADDAYQKELAVTIFSAILDEIAENA